MAGHAIGRFLAGSTTASKRHSALVLRAILQRRGFAMNARAGHRWLCALFLTSTVGVGCAGRESEAAARTLPSHNVDIATADQEHRRAMDQPGNWVEYGRDYTNQRWSPLDQITTANVGQLKAAWINHSGIPHASETGPVVLDGVMYFTTALNHVIAVDAESGNKKWEYAYDYGGHTV